MNLALALSLISLVLSFFSLYFSFKANARAEESWAPTILPNGKILIRKGVKIESVVKSLGGLDVVMWSKN